jgi:SAM-dependent methyltransferase
MNTMHEANRKGWDAASQNWQAMIEDRVDWRKCPEDPTIALSREELDHLGDVSGKDVCVLGSGDNLVVFALAGMRARVTSVDISQNQLDTGAERAVELGLDISFVRADVVDLGPLGDKIFDLVYTGGHVAVWVSDLKTYYSEASRVLRTGGTFMVSEYHPFRRVWQESPDQLKIEFGYFDRGPHQYDRSEDVPGTPAGSLPSYEFHWTVSDYVTALMDAGCELEAIDEFGDKIERWEYSPMTGLPYYLLLVGRKR